MATVMATATAIHMVIKSRFVSAFSDLVQIFEKISKLSLYIRDCNGFL
ncbi:MAG: hypothetical protein ACI9N1_002889 [Flavobacteriales bacterium]|jgi:hypothetical protein